MRARSRLTSPVCCFVVLVFCGLACFASLWCEHVEAQTAVVDDVSGYREAISRGVAEYEAGNFAEARAQFARAHAFAPSARTLRGLGVTEYELRNYVASVAYLEQALASDVKRLGGTLREDTESVLGRAREYVGEITLSVVPASATLTLDGEPVEHPGDEPLRLTVGEHLLELRAPGYAAQRRSLHVTGGETSRLAVTLLTLVDETRASLPAERRPEAKPVYKRWWLWTTIGVVVASAAVSTVLLTRDRTRIHEEPLRTPNSPDGYELQPGAP